MITIDLGMLEGSGAVPWVLAVLAGGSSVVMYFRRGMSRDVVERAQDRKEIDVMDVLSSENKTLRDQIVILSRERNDAMLKLGDLGAKVVIYAEILNSIRNGQAHIADVLVNTTALTKEAVVQAKAAYVEANNMNKKIETIGLQMKDGSSLESTS